MKRLAVELPMDKLRAFCERNQIVRLEVFGSILRDDFGPESDIDFLVTCADDIQLGLLGNIGLMHELEEMLGRKVDFVGREAVEKSRNPIRKEYILRNTEECYAA